MTKKPLHERLLYMVQHSPPSLLTYSGLAKALECPEPSVRAAVQKLRKDGHVVPIQTKRDAPVAAPVRVQRVRKQKPVTERAEIRQAIRLLVREITAAIFSRLAI